MNTPDYSELLHEIRERHRFPDTVRLALRTYSWLGIYVSILAGCYFVWTLLPFEMSEAQQLSLMVAAVGVLVSIMSRILANFYRERDKGRLLRRAEYERSVRFLTAWKIFEQASRAAMENQTDDSDTHSLRSAISSPPAKGVIDSEDLLVLERGLATRNSIIHGERWMSEEVTESLSTALSTITDKIQEQVTR